MASNVEITISQLPLPTEERLRAVVEGWEEHRFDWDDLDDVNFHEGHVYLGWWDRKWGVDYSKDLAEHISRQFPWCRVSLVEEWDARDADIAGGEGFEFVGGRLVAEGKKDWTWKTLTTEAPSA